MLASLLNLAAHHPLERPGVEPASKSLCPVRSASVLKHSLRGPLEPGCYALGGHWRWRLRRNKNSPISDNTTSGATRTKVRRLRTILRNVSVSLRCGNGLSLDTSTPRNLHKGSQPSF